MEHLRKFTDAPTVAATPGDKHYADPDQLAIQRMVRKRKGSWWLLPKDLKADGEADTGGGN